MRILRYLLLIMTLTLTAFAGDPREPEVKAAMDQLAKTMMSPSKAALDKLLGANLVYSHSSGKLENKAEVIDALVNKKSQYGAVEYVNGVSPMFYGNTAVVRADTNVKLLGAEPRSLKLNILYVWAKNPAGWQLVARQATRLP